MDENKKVFFLRDEMDSCSPEVALLAGMITESSHVDGPRLPAPLPEQVMYRWAFDLVADKTNWKKPIDAQIDAPRNQTDRELFKLMISRAVAFHTGSVPMIVDLDDKQIGVKAIGYYAAVGA